MPSCRSRVSRLALLLAHQACGLDPLLLRQRGELGLALGQPGVEGLVGAVEPVEAVGHAAAQHGDEAHDIEQPGMRRVETQGMLGQGRHDIDVAPGVRRDTQLARRSRRAGALCTARGTQVRLTKDPNALFFFIDHLGEHSPFRLENTTTWDTNIEEGIRWGLRLVEKDEEVFGKNGNPKAFLVISDGQAWSGTVANAVQNAKAMKIPVHVVGIGTSTGGMIPEPARPDGTRPPPVIRSVLDRASLVQLAVAGGGEYFEIGDEPDRIVAFRIVDRLRRRADVVKEVESFDELYGRFLMAAAIVLVIGTAFLRKRTELAWQAAGALAVVLLLASSGLRTHGPG